MIKEKKSTTHLTSYRLPVLLATRIATWSDGIDVVQTDPDSAVTHTNISEFWPARNFWASIAESPAAVFALAFASAVIVRFYGLFPSVINWDESLYAVMAQHWLRGELPYDAVWDQHSVGLPALFAAIQYFFPKSILAIRLSACAAVAAAATAVYFASRLVARSTISTFVTLSGIIAAFLYIMWTARWWGLAANTELYLNALIASGMAVVLGEMSRPLRTSPSVTRLAIAGLLFGIALHVKHVAIAQTSLFFIVAAFGVRWESKLIAAKAMCVIIFAFLLPTFVVVSYFWANGLLGAYIHAMVNANLAYVFNRISFVDAWPHLPKTLLLPLAISAPAAFLIWRTPSRCGILAVFWILASLVDVVLPGKWWGHYFLLLAPAGAVLAGYLTGRYGASMALRCRDRGALPYFGLVCVMGAVLLANVGAVWNDALIKARYFGTIDDAPRTVADYIAPRLSSGATIFVFNYEPVVYLLTGARLPTRYVQPDSWSLPLEGISGVKPLEELDGVFATRPEFVVVVAQDWNGMGEAAFNKLRQHLSSSYTKQFQIVDRQIHTEPVSVEVYARRDE